MSEDSRCSSPASEGSIDALLDTFGGLSMVESAGARPPDSCQAAKVPGVPTSKDTTCNTSNGLKPLRDYQVTLVDQVMGMYRGTDKRSALVYLPTGGGKTRIAAEIVHRVVHDCGHRALFVVNRSKLVEQAAAAFADNGLGDLVSFIKAGKKASTEPMPVIIASIQTLSRRYFAPKGGSEPGRTSSGEKRSSSGVDIGNDDELDVDRRSRGGSLASAGSLDDLFGDLDVSEDAVVRATVPSLKLPPVNLVIIDEAHGSLCESYLGLLKNALQADGSRAFILGLTATPFRLDPEERLSAVFSTLIKGPSINNLIGRGVLVPPVVLNMSDVLYSGDASKPVHASESGKTTFRAKSTPVLPPRKGGADGASAASTDSCDEALSQDRALLALVQQWKARCEDRRTIAFAADVHHSRRLVHAFRTCGVTAVHVDGTTTEADRASIFADFHDGNVTVLSSVGVLSEGFDEPAISCVILCRPTHSKAVYVQQVGRGLRSFPGKTDCLVLDVADVTGKHGTITGPAGVDWEWEDLDSEAVVSAGRSVPVTVRQQATAAKGSHGYYPGAPFIPKTWTCKFEGCSTVNNITARACERCGKVKPLSKTQFQIPAPTAYTTTRDGGGKGSTTAGSGAHGARVLRPVGHGVIAIPTATERLAAAMTAPGSTATRPMLAPTFVIPKKVAPSVASAAPVSLSTDSTHSAAAPGTHALLQVPPPTVPVASSSVGSSTLAQGRAPTVSTIGTGEGVALADRGTSAASGSTKSVSTSAFELPAFSAALTRLHLPMFDLAYAKSDWEREFLSSIAAQITPGASHASKRNVADARALSDKQRDVLQRIVARRGTRATPTVTGSKST